MTRVGVCVSGRVHVHVCARISGRVHVHVLRLSGCVYMQERVRVSGRANV